VSFIQNRVYDVYSLLSDQQLNNGPGIDLPPDSKLT